MRSLWFLATLVSRFLLDDVFSHHVSVLFYTHATLPDGNEIIM